MTYFQIKTSSIKILSATHTNVLQKTLLGITSGLEMIFLKHVFDLVCDLIKQNKTLGEKKRGKKDRKKEKKEKLKALPCLVR